MGEEKTVPTLPPDPRLLGEWPRPVIGGSKGGTHVPRWRISKRMKLRLALIDGGSSKVNVLAQLVDPFVRSMDRVALEKANTFDFQGVEALILSGGPHLFTGADQEGLRARFAFLEQVSLPILGICLGHQALALDAGGEVFRGEERRDVDVIRFRAPEHPLCAGLGTRAVVSEDHCEGASLPEGYRQLASSAFYPNEAMANNERRRFGVQFHPETSGPVGARLIRNFLGIAEDGFPET